MKLYAKTKPNDDMIIFYILAIAVQWCAVTHFSNADKFWEWKSQHIICTDQRVGVQKLSEDISHEHSHVSRSRFQQLNVLELAAQLDK